VRQNDGKQRNNDLERSHVTTVQKETNPQNDCKPRNSRSIDLDPVMDKENLIKSPDSDKHRAEEDKRNNYGENLYVYGHVPADSMNNIPGGSHRQQQQEAEQLRGRENGFPPHDQQGYQANTMETMNDQSLRGQQDDGSKESRTGRLEDDEQEQVAKDISESRVPADRFIPINRRDSPLNESEGDDLQEIGEGGMGEQYGVLSPRQLISESMPTTIFVPTNIRVEESQASEATLSREKNDGRVGNNGTRRPIVNERPKRPSHPPPPACHEEGYPKDTKKPDAETKQRSIEKDGNAKYGGYQDVPDDTSETVLITQSRDVFHKCSRVALKEVHVGRTSAFHPVAPVKRKGNHNSTSFENAHLLLEPQSKSARRPNEVPTDERKQVYRPRAKRPHEGIHGDDHRSVTSHPTVRSELLLSQTRERPNKSRRITASPRVLPKALTDTISKKSGQENNLNDKNTTGLRSSSGQWISNNVARDFVKNNPINAEKTSPRYGKNSRTNTYSGKKGPANPYPEKKKVKDQDSESETSNDRKCGKQQISNPYARQESPEMNTTINGTGNEAQTGGSSKEETEGQGTADDCSKLRPKQSNRSSHSENDEYVKETTRDEDNEADFKYIEVVRKKSEREALNGYDCPDCVAFVNAVMSGNGANVFNRDDFLRCSRHRSRHTPPQTPEDYWELSFADEKIKKLNK
jgi:hypothetical protein